MVADPRHPLHPLKGHPLLTNKKTYLVSAASLIYAGLGLVLGHLSADAAFQVAQTAILGATLRSGISSALR